MKGHTPKQWDSRTPRYPPTEEPVSIASAVGSAAAIRVLDAAELPAALHGLGLVPPLPVLVLVGGAGGLKRERELERLRPLFMESLAPLAERYGACVIDGGTDAGVMKLMGQTRTEVGGTFPLVGVVVEQLATHPDLPTAGRSDRATLEPHHTHFILVGGSRWGEESPWIVAAATALAQGAGSATVLVQGGSVAWDDAEASIGAGRRVMAVIGSGRTADALGAAVARQSSDDRAVALASSGLVSAVPMDDPQALTDELERALTGRD